LPHFAKSQTNSSWAKAFTESETVRQEGGETDNYTQFPLISKDFVEKCTQKLFPAKALKDLKKLITK